MLLYRSVNKQNCNVRTSSVAFTEELPVCIRIFLTVDTPYRGRERWEEISNRDYKALGTSADAFGVICFCLV